MAKELYHGSLTKHDEWTGVTRGETTLAADGYSIQNYIKNTFEEKIGFLYSYTSATNSEYWCFADKDNCELYLDTYAKDPNNEEYAEYKTLRLAKFDAPAPYSASIEVLTDKNNDEYFSAKNILNTSSNNYLYFKFDIVNSSNATANDNVKAVFTITNNGQSTVVNKTYQAGEIASLLLDEYLKTGTNSISIKITGVNTEASTQINYDVEVIELAITSSFDFSQPLVITKSNMGTFSFTALVQGSGQKYFEFYIDGDLVFDDKTGSNANQYQTSQSFDLGDLTTGKHSLQIRAYEMVGSSNNNKFYSSTLYYDFIVGTEEAIISNRTYEILIAGEMAPGTIVAKNGAPIVSYYQYEQGSIKFATYDYSSRKVTLNIYYNNATPQFEPVYYTYQEFIALPGSFNINNTTTVTYASVSESDFNNLDNSKKIKVAATNATSVLSATNGNINTWLYTPENYGDITTTFWCTSGATAAAKVETSTKLIMKIEQSSLNVSEAYGTSNVMVMKLSAKNRNNSETDTTNNPARSTWKSKNYSATFHNVKWTDACGWVNDALVLSSGATVDINISPFKLLTKSGLTFEIDFETSDVKSDAVKIMEYGNHEGGYKSYININATSASISSDLGTSVTTNYKDGERTKLAFVINPVESLTAPRLLWIINNGVLERCAAYSTSDNFQSMEDKITIGNPDGDVTVKIYSIRVYQTALSYENELGNFIYDSDNIAGHVANNDVMESNMSNVSLDKVKAKLPVMVFTGPMSELRALADKKTPKNFDIVYTNPEFPEYDFEVKNAYVTKQGTSSLKYPCPNFRLYTQKQETTEFKWTGLGDTTFHKNGDKFVHPQTGETVSKLTYIFKDGALPAKVWTLKADFAESSMTHNTGIARWFNEMLKNAVISGEYEFRTNAQKAVAKYAEFYPYDIRTTVDGFPMCIFFNNTNVENPVTTFMGLFNFNNDKSSTDIYGFKKIECNIPKTYAEDGVTVEEWEKKKIFDNADTFCWEGSANEEAIAKFTSIGFDKGAGLSIKDCDNRNIFAAIETRYPDADSYTTKGGTKISADMFNNTAGYETFARWVNFTKPAIFLKVKTTNVNPETNEVIWEDGYTLQSFLKATNEEIEAAKNKEANAKILYIKTSDDSEGTAATYEDTTYADSAKFLSKYLTAEIEVPQEDGTIKKQTIYVDREGNEVPAEEKILIYIDENGREVDEEHKILITEFYVKRDDILFEEVEYEKNPETIGHVYTGVIKNWQYQVTKAAIDTGKIGTETLAQDDIDYLTSNLINEKNTKGDYSVLCPAYYASKKYDSHDVTVYLTREGTAGNYKYYYIDGFGNKVEYKDIVNDEDYTGRTYIDYFNDTLSKHVKLYQLAAYYIYTRRFATVDQMIKNTMFATEDRMHWYYIHYDNDTINGVRNDSLIKYNWDVTRKTYDVSVNNYAYAGFQSVLWNNLEQSKTFMDAVKTADKALNAVSDNRGLNYTAACYWLDTMQSDKWCERLYNYSEEFKYISPFKESVGNAPYLAFLQGNRKSHRHWWLRHRFDLIDAEWVSGEYSNFYVGFYSGGIKNGAELCRCTAASDFYFGFMTNSDIKENGVYVKKGEEHIFKTVSDLNVGDPVKLLAPYQMEVLDFSRNSNLNGNMLNLDGDGEAGKYVDTRGTQLRKLILGGSDHNSMVYQISGLNKMTMLEHLDITRLVNLSQTPDISTLISLNTFIAPYANIAEFAPARGSVWKKIVLPSTHVSFAGSGTDRTVAKYDNPGSSITSITLDQFELETGGVFQYEPDENLISLTIKETKGFDSYTFVKKWLQAYENANGNWEMLTIDLEDIEWTNNASTSDTAANTAFVDFILSLRKAGAVYYKATDEEAITNPALVGTIKSNKLTLKGTINFGELSFENYSRLVVDKSLGGYGANAFEADGELIFTANQATYLYSYETEVETGEVTQEDRTIKSGKSVKFQYKSFPSGDVDYLMCLYNPTTYQFYEGRAEDDAYGNVVWEYENIKLNSFTGLLETAESETAVSSISVCLAIQNAAGMLQQVRSQAPININVSAVTVPNTITIREVSNNAPVTSYTFNTNDDKVFKIDATVNGTKSDSDAKIKEITVTYENKTTGSTLVGSRYIKMVYNGDETITIKELFIPASTTTFAATVTVKYDTTLNKTTTFKFTITLVNILPDSIKVMRLGCYSRTAASQGVAATYKFVKEFTGDRKDLVSTTNNTTYKWTWTTTEDGAEVTYYIADITSMKLTESGTYKYYVMYMCGAKESNVAISYLEIATTGNMRINYQSIKNGEANKNYYAAGAPKSKDNPGGYDNQLVSNDYILLDFDCNSQTVVTSDGHPQKVTVQAMTDSTLHSIPYLFIGGSAINKLEISMNCIFPTSIALSGNTAVNVGYNKSYKANYEYALTSTANVVVNGVNTEKSYTTKDVTVPYEITTTQEIIENPKSASVIITPDANDPTKFSVEFGKLANELGNVKIKVTSIVKVQNILGTMEVYKTIDTIITANYTYASCTSKSDMEVGKYYLIDTAFNYYEVDMSAETPVCTNWNQAKDTNTLCAIGFVSMYNTERIEMAVSLTAPYISTDRKDSSTFVIGAEWLAYYKENTFNLCSKNGGTYLKSLNISRTGHSSARNLDRDGYERTKLLYKYEDEHAYSDEEKAALKASGIYNIHKYFDNFVNPNNNANLINYGYVGTVIEVEKMIDNMLDLNKILKAYNGDIILINSNSNTADSSQYAKYATISIYNEISAFAVYATKTTQSLSIEKQEGFATMYLAANYMIRPLLRLDY